MAMSRVGINSLELRKYEQSLSLLHKCIKGNGPSYISNFFKFRVSYYNLRGGGCILVQPSGTTTITSIILLLTRLLICGASYLHMFNSHPT